MGDAVATGVDVAKGVALDVAIGTGVSSIKGVGAIVATGTVVCFGVINMTYATYPITTTKATTKNIIATFITDDPPLGFSTGGVSVIGGVTSGGIEVGSGTTGVGCIGGVGVSGTAGGGTLTLGACVGGFTGSILNINGFIHTMSRPVPKKKKSIYIELIMCVAALILLVLSSLNISYTQKPKRVLGAFIAQDNSFDNEKFWNDFLDEHPDYIPGLFETGQTEDAKKVDPNYVMP